MEFFIRTRNDHVRLESLVTKILSKNVDDLIEFPTFHMLVGGVPVKICEWDHLVDPFVELTKVIVQIEGIPPKWRAWKILAEVASCFGILVGVEWSGIFKSFYELIRVKVACRDLTKNPFERLVEIRRKLYSLFFIVKGFDQVGEDGDDHNPDSDKHSEEKVDKDSDVFDKDNMDEDNESIGELDKANFPGKSATSVC